MDNSDLDLQLLSKDPIFAAGVPVYPVSLREIAKIGYQQYSRVLGYLCITKEKIQEAFGDEYDIDPLTFLLSIAQSEELKGDLVSVLKLICHCIPEFDAENKCIRIGEASIDEESLRSFRDIVRARNGIEGNSEEEDENPANERARQLLELRRKLRKKVKDRKAQANMDDGENSLSMADLVSILAAGLHLTVFDVMEYDLYQFNDQFHRLKIFDDYQVSIQSLLHGAKKEDVNLKHWLSKIEKEE